MLPIRWHKEQTRPLCVGAERSCAIRLTGLNCLPKIFLLLPSRYGDTKKGVAKKMDVLLVKKTLGQGCETRLSSSESSQFENEFGRFLCAAFKLR